MTIDIKELDEVKKVNKPWGYEKWIADGKPNFKYVLKEILFKSNFKSSIQFHEFKEETNYVQSGTGILHYYPEPVNIKEWKNGHYSNEEINKILKNLKQQKLSPGVVFQ
jgi:Mannose-6-phosphate isomerase